MGLLHLTRIMLVFIYCFSVTIHTSTAQADGCIFKDTIFSLSFGTEKNIIQYHLNSLKNYRQAYTNCPDDGNYAYIARTSDCFFGDWITLNQDHTPGDVDGRMMLVNASLRAGDFFIVNFDGFKPSTNYEFGVWLINVCKLTSACSPLPPDILIILETSSGKRLGEFRTGNLSQSDNPSWKRYFGMFTTPDDLATVKLKMTNTTNGGCGNDFAMDDITFRECYPPPPAVELSVQPIEKKAVPVTAKPVLKKATAVSEPIKKNEQPVITMVDKDPIKQSVKAPALVKVAIPLPLITRENPVIKTIEAGDGDILIELYDNGEIDGDTISVYHNNELIVSHQGLSGKPVSFHVKIDQEHPHHELVMVADNLGSIPPNTSLMVVTANKKRYEVFISSSEQKNAKMIIQKKNNTGNN